MSIRKSVTTFAFLILGTTPLFAQPSYETNPKQTSAPEIPFDSVEFGHLPPNMYLGEAAGVTSGTTARSRR